MCSRTCFEMRDKTQPGMNVSPSSCITGGQNYICNQKRWITLSFHLNYYTFIDGISALSITFYRNGNRMGRNILIHYISLHLIQPNSIINSRRRRDKR